MPRGKKATTRKTPAVTKKNTETISYETQTIIVVLLLLFFYPVGLVLMWFWVKQWPLWLKILLSLPVFLAVLAIFFAFFIAAIVIRSSSAQYQMQLQRQRMMQPWYPTPSVSQEATQTPANTTY